MPSYNRKVWGIKLPFWLKYWHVIITKRTRKCQLVDLKVKTFWHMARRENFFRIHPSLVRLALVKVATDSFEGANSLNLTYYLNRKLKRFVVLIKIWSETSGLWFSKKPSILSKTKLMKWPKNYQKSIVTSLKTFLISDHTVKSFKSKTILWSKLYLNKN